MIIYSMKITSYCLCQLTSRCASWSL